MTLIAPHTPEPWDAPVSSERLVVRVMLRLLSLAAMALALSLAWSAWADDASVARLDGGAESLPLAGHIEVFHDPRGTASAEEMAARPDLFAPIPGDFNVGYSRGGAWWLRIVLNVMPQGAGEWYLVIDAPYVDRLQVFAPDAGPDGVSRMTHKLLGAQVPIAEREVPTTTHVVKLQLDAGRTSDILMRISGDRSLSAKPALWRPAAFVRHVTMDTLAKAFAIGVAAVTSVAALIFGLWLHRPPFAWYGAYVGTCVLVFLSNTGFLPLMLDFLPPVAVVRLHGIIGCSSLMVGGLMVRSTLFMDRRSKTLSNAVLAFASLAALGLPISALGYYAFIAPALIAGLVLLALGLPLVCALRLYHGEPAALWFFVGFTSFGVAVLWFALMVFGLLPPSPVLEWGFQLMGLIHLAAVFGGMAQAVRDGVRERQDLQARLLDASRRNEKELEGAVAARTAALKAEIDARLEAEAALHVALREQRNFLVMVSHEFRTPLGTVRAAIALIERGSADMSDRLRNETRKIVRAVARLTGLIDTFLTEDLINRASMRLDCVPVNLAAIAAGMCRECAAETGRSVTLEGPSDLQVEGDPVLLASLVENLLGNALKHSPGAVRAALGTDAHGAWFSVSDEGPGIPIEEHTAIFERYYRSPLAISRPGAGIGLYIVKRVVEMHGGTVRVRSTPGTGSTFTVWLPRAIRPALETQMNEQET